MHFFFLAIYKCAWWFKSSTLVIFTEMNRQYDVFEITIIDIASVTKIGFSKHDKPYENVR